MNKPTPSPFHVIIVAAGSGQRMGGSLPKQYQDLAGKSVLQHSIDLFESMPECKSITVAISPEHQNLFDDKIKGKNLYVIHGGKTRQDSVHNALKSLNCAQDDFVLIHDAARPLVTAQDIRILCKALASEQAASLASPVRDTLRYSDDEGFAANNIERDNLWAIETPQGFHYGILKQAHEKFGHEKAYSDDTKIVSEFNVKTKLIASSTPNFKITYADDFLLAETLLLSNTQRKD
tara:strand:- start:598 stop:1302 length:705 start_codon:yes stop_codon:yes gene_type:complete